MKKKIIYLFASAIILTTVSCKSNEKTEKAEANIESQNQELTNKAKVEAILQSFNTGNMDALVYINPDKYIQHNLSASDGIDGFKGIVEYLSATKPNVNTVRIFEDGDFVVAHTEYGNSTPTVGFDVFRFENGLAVEHWDNLQTMPLEKNPSGHSLIDGETVVEDVSKEGVDANKKVIEAFVSDILMGKNPQNLQSYFDGDNYTQHNPLIGDGLTGLIAGLEKMGKMGLSFQYTRLHKLLGQGNFVLAISEGVMGGKPTAFYDLFRVKNGKIAEHWDVLETIPPTSEHKNSNGKFGF